MTLGNGFEQLGFTGPLASSAMVNAYGLRGNFGLDYALNSCNTVGVFYQTRLDFTFPDAVRFNNAYHDLSVSQPETVGLGWANRSLMDRNLLIAADVYSQTLGKRRRSGKTSSSMSGRLPSARNLPAAN